MARIIPTIIGTYDIRDNSNMQTYYNVFKYFNNIDNTN